MYRIVGAVREYQNKKAAQQYNRNEIEKYEQNRPLPDDHIFDVFIV